MLNNNIRYINELFFTLNTLEQTKRQQSLRLKKVCPVYNTYPFTELKMYWLIQWHLCVYRGVKVWSFSYLLLSIPVNN